MATFDERLTALETAMADAQTEILRRAKSVEVSALESVRDNIKDVHDTEHTAYEERLAKLERTMAIILKTQLDLYKKDANEELAESITWSSSSLGPILKDSTGAKWRIKTSTAGALSTETVA